MVCLQSQHSVGVVTIGFPSVFPDMTFSCLVPFDLFPVFVCHLALLCLFSYNITWFVVYIFCFCFSTITWCMYYGDCELYFGGGSYSSVYVPPPLYVFPVVLIVCIPTFFSSPCYVLCTSLFPYAPCFAFAHLCEFYPHLDENFWGVYIYAFYHMQPYVDFEMCTLNILYYI